MLFCRKRFIPYCKTWKPPISLESQCFMGRTQWNWDIEIQRIFPIKILIKFTILLCKAWRCSPEGKILSSFSSFSLFIELYIKYAYCFSCFLTWWPSTIISTKELSSSFSFVSIGGRSSVVISAKEVSPRLSFVSIRRWPSIIISVEYVSFRPKSGIVSRTSLHNIVTLGGPELMKKEGWSK